MIDYIKLFIYSISFCKSPLSSKVLSIMIGISVFSIALIIWICWVLNKGYKIHKIFGMNVIVYGLEIVLVLIVLVLIFLETFKKGLI